MRPPKKIGEGRNVKIKEDPPTRKAGERWRREAVDREKIFEQVFVLTMQPEDEEELNEVMQIRIFDSQH